MIQLRHRYLNSQFLVSSFIIILCVFQQISASQKKNTKDTNQEITLFKELSPEQTGISFLNLMAGPQSLKKESRLFTIASGGTSVGDVNGDGLIDIYLTSFTGKNSLYINKGNLKFEEAPASAGVTDSAGSSFGSTMVDIDGDGDLDIYVTKYNLEPNKLFINDGKGTFTEKAREFGLASIGNGIQSTFFDYDLDGDLDVMIMHNGFSRTGFKHDGVTPVFMRNNGDNTFSDITKEAGITHKGFGLSCTSGDINNDGWPDLYITNDFEEKDYIYINKRDGTFERKSNTVLPHTVMFGMGSDIADFNNDNLLDIVAVDMLPETHERINTQFDNFSTFSSTFDTTQFIQNTLNLNRGIGRFSDIAQVSGVDATEWSWTVFFADFNLDGFKDLFIANGLNWDIMDKDLRRLGITHEMIREMYEKGYKKIAESSKLKGDVRELAEEFDIGKLIREVKRTKTANYLFRNNGDLSFSKVTESWGMKIPYNSCSASFADFDNDGDLDMIVNNIDTIAVFYQNTVMETQKSNFIKIQCKGNTKNTQGIGARVEVKTKDILQTAEVATTRGFASGVSSLIHFGLGEHAIIDELVIKWPGGARQILKKVKANQLLTLSQANATLPSESEKTKSRLFREITNTNRAISFLHKENPYDDFYQERLLPNQLSINGPALASADIDGNGLNDVAIGGAQGYPLSIFLQQSDGSFIKAVNQEVFMKDSLYEDQGILLFDADMDGDIDIYVASGGNELSVQDKSLLQDRLYLNNGSMQFSKSTLPDMPVAKSCVIGNDIDNDGDIDLFVGGRNIPGSFSTEPRSYLLLNDKGNFSDITVYIANPLMQPGRVKSALWTDFDNDGDKDLIVVGDWMKILLLENSNGAFFERSKDYGLDTTNGMWNSINGADIDNDGDTDYILGNVGINSRYAEPTNTYPFEMYCSDFDENGSIDYIQGYYENGTLYPSRVMGSLLNQIPTLRKNFNDFDDIAKVTLPELFGGDSILKTVKKLHASLHRSVALINNGKYFAIVSLPMISQISPLFGNQIIDINEDGNLDIIHAGNFYGPDRDAWRFDAGIGEVLLGNGKGGFSAVSPEQSGIYVPGEARAMIALPTNQKTLNIIIGSNKDSVKTFMMDLSQSRRIINVENNSTHAIIKFKSGKKRLIEFYQGNGYYSQSPHFLMWDPTITSIEMFNKNTLLKTVNK